MVARVHKTNIMNQYSTIISQSLNMRAEQVEAVLGLLDAGATIPFISRYRKEATGNLNEVQVAASVTSMRN